MADQPASMADRPSNEDLARLPRAEQQRRLGGQPTGPQPPGAGPAPRGRTIQAAPQQRMLSPEEQAARMEAFQRAASRQGPFVPFEQQQAADDPSWTPQHVSQGVRRPDGGPHEGFERRMACPTWVPGARRGRSAISTRA
jgi:hypothetical protein